MPDITLPSGSVFTAEELDKAVPEGDDEYCVGGAKVGVPDAEFISRRHNQKCFILCLRRAIKSRSELNEARAADNLAAKGVFMFAQGPGWIDEGPWLIDGYVVSKRNGNHLDISRVKEVVDVP